MSRAGRTWRLCSVMGPQTAGAVGSDAKGERKGNHTLAEKVGGFLKQEQAALPTLIQWCRANGYGYYGDV